MVNNKKNLKDLEYSIYALQSKASSINEKIKKYSKSSELKSEEKNKILNTNNKNINFIKNKFSNEKIHTNSLELKEKLENEVLELKKNQKRLIFVLYVTILLILFFLITVIELKLFVKI